MDDHITRVYVLPEHQKKGYGTFIVKNIEEQIGEKFDKAYLDASLPAAALYEKLGFVTVMHERYPVENGVILAYEVMEKELHKISTDINYDGRKFISKMNFEMVRLVNRPTLHIIRMESYCGLNIAVEIY